ncbi:hypothetical protein HMPREF9064_0984 [Aggregatibacter segnis ATCC 33393]|uniref:Uncharacterized protein n=1 Tax=Aggregatibacter segnis ATCC 33393 TaxID=888057 RepID=E6KXV2_9PAST|nr:hypothetical protein HMPREF9064_0984 [Aggregatibacter segnis ATCC 33393]
MLTCAFLLSKKCEFCDLRRDLSAVKILAVFSPHFLLKRAGF